MAIKLSAATAHVVDELRALGVPATADPQTIVVPGAWVAVRRVVPRITIDGSAEVQLVAYLLAGDYDVSVALDRLAELLEQAAPLASPGEPIEALTLALPNYAQNGLPALA